MFTPPNNLLHPRNLCVTLLLAILTGCASHDETLVSSQPTTNTTAVLCDPDRLYNTVVDAPDVVGALPIDRDHIFCGEVSPNQKGVLKAKGFHSRPDGINPVTINETAQTMTTAHTHNQQYALEHFDITQYVPTDNTQQTRTKSLSTMFPDSCSYQQVLNSIAHAYNNPAIHNGNDVKGPSAPTPATNDNYCLSDKGAFNIQIYTGSSTVIYNGTVAAITHIRTAHPL